jgi:hypothetical protein
MGKQHARLMPFFLVNGVMALIGDYHKGHQTSGLYKQVLHLIPNELGHLVAILLCIVRPIEMAVVGKFFITQDDERSVMRKAYQLQMFITYSQPWTSQHLSTLLMSRV